jgi:hypothetical protein
MTRAHVGVLLATLALAPSDEVARAQAPTPRPAATKPKPAPAPPPVLEGVVRGPDKKPVEKALVAAVGTGPWSGMTGVVSTRTDAEGRFRLALKKRDLQTVRVEAAGLAPRTLKNVAAGTPLTIDLARGGAIQGTVRDGDTGQPLAGVRIEARDAGALSVSGEPEAGRVTATSDAEGRFTVGGLAPGLHRVIARGRAAGFASRAGVRVGSRVDLLLFPAATITGTVTGPDNRPLAGASVHAVGASLRRPSPDVEPTDAQGRYEINGLEGGEYDVVAMAPGLAPGVAPDVTLERRSEARIDLVLRPGVRVKGRLVDLRERPVAGRVIVGEIEGRTTPHVLADRFTTEAPADGRFELAAVPPGENALGVLAPGHAFQRVDFTARANDRVVDVGDVRLETGVVIRGRVRTASGQAIVGASVMAFATQMRPTAGSIPLAEADAEGAFVLAGLEQMPYRLTARAPGFAQTDKNAEPGGDPVDLVMEPAGTIVGLVVDDRSKPVETFRVAARASDEPRVRHVPPHEEVTSEDGRFALADVGAGVYAVTVSSTDRASTTVSGVKVAAGATADVGTVKLGAGGIVRGTVVDEGGGFVPGARVTASGQGRDWFATGDGPESTSDLSGAFEIKGVAAGTTQVSASHPSFAASEPVTVEVDPAKGAADVRVVLAQGGRVAGSVRRRDGTPLPGAMVRVDPARRGRTAVMVLHSEIRTGSDGTFAVEHVPAGRAHLMVMIATRPGQFAGGLTREVEVRAGETTQVEVVSRDILLSGRVMRSGSPGAGLRVEARSARHSFMGGTGGMPAPAVAGPQRMHAVTREDGGFEMLLDEPGDVTLSVSTADGRLRLPARTVEVPDADAHTVELVFSGVPLTGMVVDKDTEAPIPYASVQAAPHPPRPGGGSGGTTGPDGRFVLEAEPGDYRIVARVYGEGYGATEVEARVGSSGLADLRLELPKGLEISGRVTDAAGRPIGGVNIFASGAKLDSRSFGFGPSLADGTFRLEGLEEGTFHLVAQTDAGTFAVRPNVATGTKNVALVLRPGARVEVSVVMPSGEPAPGLWPRVTRFNGLALRSIGRATAPTDAQGSTTMLVPAGDLVIETRRMGTRGEASVRVAEGEIASVRITLEPGSTPAP